MHFAVTPEPRSSNLVRIPCKENVANSSENVVIALTLQVNSSGSYISPNHMEISVKIGVFIFSDQFQYTCLVEL